LGDGRSGHDLDPCSVVGCTNPGGRAVRSDRPVCEYHYGRERREKIKNKTATLSGGSQTAEGMSDVAKVRKAIVQSMEEQCDFGHVGLIGAHVHWDKVAQAAIDSLSLTEDRELLHGPTFELLGDGITIAGDGVSAHVDCHLCEKSFGYGSPREAFDTAYEHAVEKHDLTLHYRTRLVSPLTQSANRS
jgi:hypothetical protein